LLVTELAFGTTVAGYAAASVLFFIHLTSHQRPKRSGRVAPSLLAIGSVCHAGYIVAASLTSNVCPIKSVSFVVSFAALLGMLIYLALWRYTAMRMLGAFLAPAALTFVLGARFMSGYDRHVSPGFLALHVTANVLGDALFLLASAAAVLYLVEERRIKGRRAGSVFGRLPPLDTLDRAGHRFLLSGFPLLTLGIITGTVWSHRLQTGSGAEIVRAVFAYATWSLFAGVLVLRTVLGWRGRRAAYGTLAGFAFAVAVLAVYLFRSTPGGPA
jgi:ABC-type uncharacterized transport system permease subunit